MVVVGTGSSKETSGRMKPCMSVLVFALLVCCACATPRVDNLKVTPVSPWGMVLDYTVDGAEEGDGDVPLLVTLADGDKTYTAVNLTGAVRCGNGSHRVCWNTAKDGITAEIADGTVTVRYLPFLYCVVDLADGADAASYPVTRLTALPEGGWTDEYKTTKLVLRRIPAGSFIMGEDQTDESHRVTLTKPFYMGVFPVTQKQWQLVMGVNISNFKGDMRPMECVSYDDIRGSSQGARWPLSNAVDASSFLGSLRAKTGLDFDLPTEAQWEYACRAGTTTLYYWGDMMDGSYAWYRENSNSETHPVGMKLSNAWGLYDMSGNVWELCLDWWYGTLTYGTDPVGVDTGSCRVGRGGSWYDGFNYFVSSNRGDGGLNPSSRIYNNGFRLAMSLSH